MPNNDNLLPPKYSTSQHLNHSIRTQTQGSIGVFDSGYGGLTVFKEMVAKLPQYDFLYLGDNARAPYGSRSFETVYHYTLECVRWFFSQGCPLVILACNTASAKALRTIQQNDLQKIALGKRVLGVLRPTTEKIGTFTRTGNIGILGTKGTVQSKSYLLEIKKFYPRLNVYQEACPMWVPLIENNEDNKPGADYFIKKNLDCLLFQSKTIDTILLACTHYPLIISKIREFIPDNIALVSQGGIVADSLNDYLKRHNEIESCCSKNASVRFVTTDSSEDFDNHGSRFYGAPVKSIHINL
jgi:glutamate racemase